MALIQAIKLIAEEGVENDILLLQRWHPGLREGWVTPRAPGARQRLALRGERLWMRRRASSVPWGPKSDSPDQSWTSSFYVSLEDSQNFQNLHVFFFSWLLLPNILDYCSLTNTDTSVSANTHWYSFPALGEPLPLWVQKAEQGQWLTPRNLTFKSADEGNRSSLCLWKQAWRIFWAPSTGQGTDRRAVLRVCLPRTERSGGEA